MAASSVARLGKFGEASSSSHPLEHAGVSWSLSTEPCTLADVSANLVGLKSKEDLEGFICSKHDLKRERVDVK